MKLRATRHGALSGTLSVPGDKSISHRSLMLAALAEGRSRIEGLLEGEDVLATAHALQAMGLEATRLADGAWQVEGGGAGGLREPAGFLDLGNAGTAVRLLMGILAGRPFPAFLSGDASLCRRPMQRVVEPLRRMGAEITARSGDRLPLAIRGGALRAIEHRSRVASAQVKSAVLLAGLAAEGETSVVEPLASRDHTERMLSAMGAVIRVEDREDGSRRVTVQGRPTLKAQDVVVPGDPSSAGFPIVAALVTPGSRVLVRGVGLNPLRTGLIATLREMGARLSFIDERVAGGEPVADILVEGSALEGVEVPERRAPSMIDEYPIVAALVTPGSRVLVRGVGLNPLRTGLIATLREMGARLSFIDERMAGGEPVADILVEASALEGVEVPERRAPSMIDEYPILAMAAAFARGRTVMRGLSELRVKESDRFSAILRGLHACGVRVEAEGDDLTIHGGDVRGEAVIDAGLDHRIAMSFLVLGGAARFPVLVEGAETIETSFPGFAGLMRGLGAKLDVEA